VVDAGGRLIAHSDLTMVLSRTDFSQLRHVRTALSGGSATVINSGNIAASNGFGVKVNGTGAVTNFGTITGGGKYYDGVYVLAGSITNAASASIAGGGYGVLDDGAIFNGSNFVGVAVR
jgi:hypothetical protein